MWFSFTSFLLKKNESLSNMFALSPVVALLQEPLTPFSSVKFKQTWSSSRFEFWIALLSFVIVTHKSLTAQHEQRTRQGSFCFTYQECLALQSCFCFWSSRSPLGIHVWNRTAHEFTLTQLKPRSLDGPEFAFFLVHISVRLRIHTSPIWTGLSGQTN